MAQFRCRSSSPSTQRDPGGFRSGPFCAPAVGAAQLAREASDSSGLVDGHRARSFFALAVEGSQFEPCRTAFARHVPLIPRLLGHRKLQDGHAQSLRPPALGRSRYPNGVADLREKGQIMPRKKRPLGPNGSWKTGQRVPEDGNWKDQYGTVSTHYEGDTFPPCVHRQGECAFRERVIRSAAATA